MDDVFDYKETKWEKIKYFPIRLWTMIHDYFYDFIINNSLRLFRGYSNIDIFDLFSELTHIILPRLIQFKKINQSYPSIFSDWDEEYGCMNLSKEEYNKAIQEGRLLGGGFETWNEIIDKMIFAFTHILVEDTYQKNKFEKKLVKDFKDVYGDTRQEVEENKINNSYHLWINPNATNDFDIASIRVPSSEFEKTKKEYQEKGYEYKGFKERYFYYNNKLSKELYKKRKEGLKLFGEYFESLWS